MKDEGLHSKPPIQRRKKGERGRRGRFFKSARHGRTLEQIERGKGRSSTLNEGDDRIGKARLRQKKESGKNSQNEGVEKMRRREWKLSSLRSNVIIGNLGRWGGSDKRKGRGFWG